jgi:hypothetical protein
MAAAAARAGDGIWSALVLATNEHPPKAVPAELKPFAGGLKTVFGYNTFYLLAAKQKQILKGSEAWIVPTKEVFLKVRCLDRSEIDYRVQLELYVKKKLVVTSEAKLARGAPLYIRGPSWGRGRLIFILEVR